MNINNNKTIDVGVFQINSVHKYRLSDLVDCDKNIEIAYELQQKQGWAIWSTYKLIK